MAKRKTKWGERTYKRFLKEGRGKGDLSLYKPCDVLASSFSIFRHCYQSHGQSYQQSPSSPLQT